MDSAPFSQTAVRTRFVAGALALLALAGCETTSQIELDDKHVSFPSFRIGVGLNESSRPPVEPQTGNAIEFGFVRARSSAEQTLAAGRPPVIYGNTTFLAPNQLVHDSDIDYADLSFRWRKFFGERSLGLELSGGFGHTSMGLTVTSASQRSTARFRNSGTQGSVGLVWCMRPSSSLHARISGFVSGDNTGVSDIKRYQLFLSQGFGDHLALHAGYAKWEVNGASGLGASNFRMTFAGPMLELGLDY